MAEVLEDLSLVHSQSSNAHRKRARQDSACTTDDNLALVNGGAAGTGSSSNHSSDDGGLEGSNRESGRHKRQRGENHEDPVLSRTTGQWSLSTSTRSRSLSPASNATQSSEHTESTAFSPDDFIPIQTVHSQEGLQEPHRSVNETNHAEEDIARSMEFDQQMDILRRSPDTFASRSRYSTLSEGSANLEIAQTQASINPPLNTFSEELSSSTHGENAPHRDARSDLVPRLLRRMHLRSNESSGSNLSSVGTDDMASSSSSLFRSASANRPSHPVPSLRLRSLTNSETVTTPNNPNPNPNTWVPYEDTRQTLPSVFPNPLRLSLPRDRTQLPTLSHALHPPRNARRSSFLNHDPIASSSRGNTAARLDPPAPSSRNNPAPLRSSDWFQDMHDLFHPYTSFNFEESNSSPDSGRESPLSISDNTQSRQSPEIENHGTSTVNTSQQMEGIEQISFSLQDHPSLVPLEDSVHVEPVQPQSNVAGSSRLPEIASANMSPLRRSGSERNGGRAFSPVPWRNFLAGLDSRESSLENLTPGSSTRVIVPERPQANNQGQSTSLVGTLRDLLHRSTSSSTTQGESSTRRRVRNPFRAFERTRSTSLDTEERISGLIDDDFPVLSMPPAPAATVGRASRSLLDPALRFNTVHSSASSSSSLASEQRSARTGIRRNLRTSWSIDMSDDHLSEEPEPFIPEPIRSERIDQPRPRSLASLFGIGNRNSSASLSGPSQNERTEPSWSQLYRNTNEARSSTAYTPQYIPPRHMRRSSASTVVERSDFQDMDQDSDRTVGSTVFPSSSAQSTRSPTSNFRPPSPLHPPNEQMTASESYLSRLQRHLRRAPAANNQRVGQSDPPLSESNIRTNNLGSSYGSQEPWVSPEGTSDPHWYPRENSRPLPPDFLFSRRPQNAPENLVRPNVQLPNSNNRFVPPSLSRDNAIRDATRNLSNEATSSNNGGGGDVNRTWRIPAVRNGESFNDLVRRRAARADALREAQPWTPWYREPTTSDMNQIGQRSGAEQLRVERLTRLERLRNSLSSMETTAPVGDTTPSERERTSVGFDHYAFAPRVVADRSSPLSRSNSENWSSDSPRWTNVPRLPSVRRFPPLVQPSSQESQGLAFASPVPPRVFADQDSTSAEDDTSTSVSRERQQLRDIISRRIREEDNGPRGFWPRLDRSSTQSDLYTPLADASARLQRRLRESEAQVDRALRALDQWGELEQRDIEPSQSYMHRYGERRRLSSFLNSTASASASDWDTTTGFNSFQAHSHEHRGERRSPSPPTLNIRQQMRQARFARAQNRFREGSDLFGERRRNRFELRGHIPRILGDYIADEDFDSSYETLLQLSSLIGDVKPRGTAPHLLARMPTGFYKDFCEPDGETRCPICLDDYKELDPVLRISDCSHWFHKGCLEQWLQNARTCPLCKTVVKGRQREKKSAENAVPGPSRGDDDSDNDDLHNDGIEGSPSLTLEELGSYAAGWL